MADFAIVRRCQIWDFRVEGGHQHGEGFGVMTETIDSTAHAVKDSSHEFGAVGRFGSECAVVEACGCVFESVTKFSKTIKQIVGGGVVEQTGIQMLWVHRTEITWGMIGLVGIGLWGGWCGGVTVFSTISRGGSSKVRRSVLAILSTEGTWRSWGWI